MTQQIQNVVWQDVVDIKGRIQKVALQAINFATDTTWTISPIGSVKGAIPAGNAQIQANYIIVDNINNAASITISWNALWSFTVPAYTRQRYLLGGNNPVVMLKGSLGTLNIYFTETPWIGDEDSVNFLPMQRKVPTGQFSAHNSTQHILSIPPEIPPVVIAFDTVDYDTLSGFDAVNNQYKCPVAAFLMLDFLFQLQSAAANSLIQIDVLKNGSVFQSYLQTINAASTHYSAAFAFQDQCTVNDIYKTQITATNGAGYLVNCQFQGVLF